MRTVIATCVLFLISVCGPMTCGAIETDELDALIGYTVLAVGTIELEHENDDLTITIRLDNGMRFETDGLLGTGFEGSSVAVFVRTLSVDELRRIGVKPLPTKPMTLYSLLVDDQLTDAFRLR